MSFVIYSPKTRKCWNQNFLQEVDKNCVGKIGFSQTLILLLWVVTPPCFPIKIGHREEMGEEIKPWFWYISIPQQLKFFHISSYFFRFRLSSGENGWSKLDQKCLVLVRPFSRKTQTLQKIFKKTFWFAWSTTFGENFGLLDYIEGVRTKT